MKATKITEDIFLLSVNVKDILFEELWELPSGVTLNSFIVKGEKTAIIDGFCNWDGVPEHLYELLEEIKIDVNDIDYAIINHMEPDHTGWIENFRKLNDHFKIYTNKKAADILKVFYNYEDNVVIVKEGDTIDLGNGKVLSFHPTPNVHWPDTMMTLETSTKTLFTCDMYGAFGELVNSHFDDELSEEEKEVIVDEEIRYYSNVLNTFNSFVKKAIDKTRTLEPSIIAPGHGAVYRHDVNSIIDRYEEIYNYSLEGAKEEVALLWGSMYGMTKAAKDLIVKELVKRKIKYHELHMPYATNGDVLSKVIRCKYVVIAAPTYEFNLYPPISSALEELGKKKIVGKKCIYVGSFGWGSKASKELDHIIEFNKMNWDVKEVVQFKGSLKGDDEEKVRAAIDTLLR